MHINACKRACLYAGVTAVGVRGWHYALQQRTCESFNPQVVLLRVAGRRAHAHAMATLLLLAVKHPGDRGRVLQARVSLCFTRLHTQLVRCRALTFGSSVNTCNRQWTARPLTANRTCRTGFPPPVRVVVYQGTGFNTHLKAAAIAAGPAATCRLSWSYLFTTLDTRMLVHLRSLGVHALAVCLHFCVKWVC